MPKKRPPPKIFKDVPDTVDVSKLHYETGGELYRYNIDKHEYPINELRKKCLDGDEEACKKLERHFDKLDNDLERLMDIVEGEEASD